MTTRLLLLLAGVSVVTSLHGQAVPGISPPERSVRELLDALCPKEPLPAGDKRMG